MTEQMTLPLARAARDLGIERSKARAEKAIPGWSDLALAFLRLYAMRRSYFTGEDVVDAFNEDPKGYERPPSDTAWGGVFQRAQRQEIIEKTKGTRPRRKGNCSPGYVYRSLIKKGKA